MSRIDFLAKRRIGFDLGLDRRWYSREAQIMCNRHFFRIEFNNATVHPMNMPSIAPRAKTRFLFGDDGDTRSSIFKTLKVSGWEASYKGL